MTSATPWPSSPPSGPPPGWYPDPDPVRPGWRWWDGARWADPSPPIAAAPMTYDPSHGDMRVAEPAGWFPQVRPLPAAAAWLGIGFMAAITVASRSTDALPTTAAAIVSLLLLIPSTAGLPLVAWYGSRRWGSRDFAADLGFRFRPIDLAIGLGGAFVLTVAVTLTSLLLMGLGAEGGSNLNDVKEGGQNVPTFLLLFVFAGLIAPVVEEIMFRGLILRGLLSMMGPWMAIGVQGVVFGLAHLTPSEGWGNVTLIASLSVVGVLLGVITRLTGRLGTAIVAHAVFNCVQLTLLWVTLG